MKERIIIVKGTDLFLRLSFKIVSIADIVYKMFFLKKNICKYLIVKELFVSKSSVVIHKAVHNSIETIVAKNYNAIEENFEIRKMFRGMFKKEKSTLIYQLREQYSDIYRELLSKEVYECKEIFIRNIEKGIREELYRKDLNFRDYVSFYYLLIFSVNGNIISENESDKLELEALEYHTRAMVTEEGIIELEKLLKRC